MKIEIEGIAYQVLGERSYDFEGKDRTMLTLKRPRGRVTYLSVRYGNGSYSQVTAWPTERKPICV